jgi:hypothetical protein
MRWPGTDHPDGAEGHSQREGGVAEKGREPTIPEFVMADRDAPIAAIPDHCSLSRLAARVQPLGSYCRT